MQFIKKACLGFLVVALTLFGGVVQARDHSAKAYSFGVRIVGKGKPMILIPGNKGAADTYNEVVAHYKNRYKCYVITLAGFAGQPPSGAHDHLLLRQRDELIQYIIQHHLHKPVLVGFSFGAGLAMWIACTRPDLIGPFIDLDGTPFDAAVDADHFDKDSLIKANGARYQKLLLQGPAYWKRRDSIYHSPANNKLGFIEVQKLVSDTNRIAEIFRWDAASDFRSAVLMNLEADTLDMRDAVANIRSPILLLGSWKGWDLIQSKAEAEKRYGIQFAKAKNLTMVFSEQGKHFLMWEDYDWMIRQMDRFLAK
jgi:pimeloyl-ACP methyl ester carboxylesterase